MTKNFIIAILFVTMSLIQAQEKTETAVQAQVSAKSFYMGQPFTYSILVDGSNKVKPPFINSFPGFAIKKLEERALKSADKNGFVMRYDLIPLESGNLIIPAVSVEVNGKETLTEEIKIHAKKPEVHPGLKLSILVSQNEVYVGEPFLLTFIWESEIPLYTLKAVDVKLPMFQDSAFRSILPFNSPSGGSKDSIGLPVSNIRMICSHDIFVKDEKRVEVLKFQKVVMARYAGEFSIKPATLLCSFIPPSTKELNHQKNKNWKPNYPSYFNNDFFEQTGNVVHSRYIATSNSIDIKVKDLPVDGKPDDFYGVVGKCEVTASADPLILEAGAPLHVSVKISGYDFPSTLKLPDLSRLSTFNRNFSIPKHKSSGEYENSSKIFTQTLRPLRTDVSAIPPVRIPYFDPQTGTYNIAQSKEISITVKPAGKVTAFDAELSSEANLKNRLLNSPQGIRHNNLDLESMKKSSYSPASMVFCALFLPAIFYCLFFLATRTQRLKQNDPAAYRSLKALSSYLKESPSDIAQLEKVTRQYFADKLNIAADAHTRTELMDKLKVSSADASILSEVYEAFDRNRFNEGSTPPDLASLKNKTDDLIRKVNGRLKDV